MRYFFGFIGTLLVISCISAQTVQEKIEKAWTERQDKVKSAVFELNVEATYPKGCQSRVYGDILGDKVVPIETKHVTYKAKLTLSEDSIRMDEDGYYWYKDQLLRGSTCRVITRGGKQELIENRNGTSSLTMSPDVDYSQTRAYFTTDFRSHLKPGAKLLPTWQYRL